MSESIDQPSNQDLFHTALKMKSGDREAYLDKACEKNPAQKEEIQSLLASHDEAETFLSNEPAPMETVLFEPPKSIQQYELTEKIGEGAMGVIFKAEDSILGRTVAIKFLKPEIYPTLQSVDRLKREAKALAGVNSPCIATIHDLIESDGICAIVLEYVEGESLRMRLDRHHMTIEEAIRTATLICEGLKQAHDKGIVHRDLKPSNIILTREKGLKILDFGLAKLENSLTSSEETQAGTILGTTAYMSPEQTRGESASSSSDLWGLGCILFEMLTATHPFKASNTADTIANILKSSPSWESLPPGLPSPTPYLMRQCLESDAGSRLQSASAAYALLSTSLETIRIPVATSETQSTKKRSKNFLIFGLGLICSIIGLVVGISLKRPTTGADLRPDAGNTGKAIKIPIQLGSRSEMSMAQRFSISPDGSQIVYANTAGLWHQSLRSVKPPTLLTRSITQEAFWNPACNAIAYLEGNILYAHSIETNTRMVVVELPGRVIPNNGGGVWLPNNIIRFNTGDEGIKEVTLHQHASLRSILDITDTDDNFHDASALPHGRGLLFATHHRNGGIDTLSVWTPETQRKDIFKLPGLIIGYPVYSDLGYILFCSYLPQSNMQFSKIWAFPFDLKTLEKTGPKFLLDEKGGFSLTMSDNNTLVYKLPQKKPRRHQLAWLGGSVEEAQYPESGFVRDVIMSISVSPDQSKVAFSTADASSNKLWVHNFESSTSHLVQTSPSVYSLSSILWKNEDHLVYHTWDADGVFTWEDDLRRATPPRKISRGLSVDISNDGRQLLVQGLPRCGRHSVINLDDPESEIKILPENLNDVWAPKFSPSQKFISFVAGEERKDSSIYLTDYPDGHIRFLVNKELPGKQPFWHPSKDILYFIHTKENQNEIYSVTVDTMPDVQLSNPRLESILPKSASLGTPYNPHIMAYHEEKKRFLFIEDQTPDDTGEKNRGNALLIPNWRPRVLFTSPDVTEEEMPESSL